MFWGCRLLLPKSTQSIRKRSCATYFSGKISTMGDAFEALFLGFVYTGTWGNGRKIDLHIDMFK